MPLPRIATLPARRLRCPASQLSQFTFPAAAFVLAVILVTSLLPAAPAAAESGPPREIRLHVDTPAYTLEGGTLAVADISALDVPGAPSLPMWGQIVELPADVEWSITYTATGEQTVPLSAPLDAVPVADLDLNSPYGALAQDVPDALPVVDRPDPAIYGQDAFYPASLAQAGPEGVRRRAAAPAGARLPVPVQPGPRRAALLSAHRGGDSPYRRRVRPCTPPPGPFSCTRGKRGGSGECLRG